MIKKLFPLVLCMLIPSVVVFAQSGQDSGDVWICPGGEIALYSTQGMAYGGGFSVGYGKGTSIGLRAAWFFAPEGTGTLELSFLFRVYFFGPNAYSGPFIQFTGGPALFFLKNSEVTIPSEFGMISAGLNFGWRFLFEDRWFIEPSVRAGYPYIAGAGVFAGVRF